MKIPAASQNTDTQHLGENTRSIISDYDKFQDLSKKLQSVRTMFEQTDELISKMEKSAINQHGLTNDDVLDLVQQTKQLKFAITCMQKLPEVY